MTDTKPGGFVAGKEQRTSRDYPVGRLALSLRLGCTMRADVRAARSGPDGGATRARAAVPFPLSVTAGSNRAIVVANAASS